MSFRYSDSFPGRTRTETHHLLKGDGKHAGVVVVIKTQETGAEEKLVGATVAGESRRPPRFSDAHYAPWLDPDGITIRFGEPTIVPEKYVRRKTRTLEMIRDALGQVYNFGCPPRGARREAAKLARSRTSLLRQFAALRSQVAFTQLTQHATSAAAR